MKKLHVTILVAAALLGLLTAGCDTDTPNEIELLPPQLSGDEYLGGYVALGNSLTAGYMDAGLIASGQANSYPALIAQQIGLSSAEFVQPTVLPPGIGSSAAAAGNVAGVLYFDAGAMSIDVLGETPLAQVQSLLPAVLYPVPYNNLGIPGATALDMTQALDSTTSQKPGNSFFDFILRNPNFGNTNVLTQAVGKEPTLVTLWIGNNDILGGIFTGAPEVGVNITPPAAFQSLLDGVVGSIYDGVAARNGVEPLVMVATIPDIVLPYLVAPTTFQALLQSPSPIPTVEEGVAYFLFDALSYMKGGGALPVPAQYTLTAAEYSVVSTAIDGFNTAINTVADARGAVVVDVNVMLNSLATGGIPGLSAQHFLVNQATAFSLDGLHFNNVGYGLVANVFIEKLNTVLGSALSEPIPLVDVTALSWDPTYGQGVVTRPPAGKAVTLTPAAAEAMTAIFR